MTIRTITINEGQRQVLLMALALLSIEMPGFYFGCRDAALQIDSPDGYGNPEMYEALRALRLPACGLTDKDIEEIWRGIASGAGDHGDFLRHFARAFLWADPENRQAMEGSAHHFVAKYRLEKEWREAMRRNKPINETKQPGSATDSSAHAR
jgi:hypothetical protein